MDFFVDSLLVNIDIFSHLYYLKQQRTNMINSLPIYSNVAETQKKRREEFYKEVGPIYSKLKKMPKEKYFEIKQDFDAGDKSALDRLMDESIYFIVEDVVESAEEYYSIAFRKGSDVTAKVNEILKSFKEDGTLKKTADKYGLADALVG